MDNDNVNIHNGYKNEVAFLFEANEMGNIKTNSLDVGNSSKSIFLKPHFKHRRGISGYKIMSRLASWSHEILPFNIQSPANQGRENTCDQGFFFMTEQRRPP